MENHKVVLSECILNYDPVRDLSETSTACHSTSPETASYRSVLDTSLAFHLKMVNPSVGKRV